MANLVELLREGSVLLAPILTSKGYVVLPFDTGTGSGGDYAMARWVCGDRFVETHVRHALGIVDYGWGTLKIGHRDYLRVVGVQGAYPGYSADPIEGFRHLAADLAGPASRLLDCTHDEFAAAVESAAQLSTRRLP
jgi:hypothetical protein